MPALALWINYLQRERWSPLSDICLPNDNTGDAHRGKAGENKTNGWVHVLDDVPSWDQIERGEEEHLHLSGHVP